MEETVAELNIAPLPATLRGVASARLADAGANLGMDWWPQDKFMRPIRSHNGFACGAHCMLGCRCGAKWNAAEFVDEAVQNGINLWTGARVDKILQENGRVIGVSGQKGAAYPLTWHCWGQTYGVMIKLKDDVSGAVKANADGFTIHKGLTANDRQRLTAAEAVATKLLQQVGCNSETIFTTPLRGTHPSGTVRLGEMLDSNLQTEIAGLYVCDASVFPEALARPTVLTIICLAKRLAAHLQTVLV